MEREVHSILYDREEKGMDCANQRTNVFVVESVGFLRYS